MDFGSQPVPVTRLIDRVCDEFESAWRDGGRPRIEDYLQDVAEPGRSALLRRSWHRSWRPRRQRGEQPGPEEYLGRFPADFELIRSAFGESGPRPGIGGRSPPAGRPLRVGRVDLAQGSSASRTGRADTRETGSGLGR